MSVQPDAVAPVEHTGDAVLTRLLSACAEQLGSLELPDLVDDIPEPPFDPGWDD